MINRKPRHFASQCMVLFDLLTCPPPPGIPLGFAFFFFPGGLIPNPQARRIKETIPHGHPRALDQRYISKF